MNDKIKKFLAAKDNIISLRQFLFEYDISEAKFISFKAKIKDKIRNKIEKNIVNQPKNIKELLFNLNESFKEISYIKDNAIKIIFLDKREENDN